MLTAAEFEAKLDEGVPYIWTAWNGNVYEGVYDGDFWDEANGSAKVDFGDHTVNYVDGETGGEGSGEYIWQVWSATDADGNVQYFRKTGYYMSYEGSTWDGDLIEVVPFEKTVTDWKKK